MAGRNMEARVLLGIVLCFFFVKGNTYGSLAKWAKLKKNGWRELNDFSQGLYFLKHRTIQYLVLYRVDQNSIYRFVFEIINIKHVKNVSDNTQNDDSCVRREFYICHQQYSKMHEIISLLLICLNSFSINNLKQSILISFLKLFFLYNTAYRKISWGLRQLTQVANRMFLNDQAIQKKLHRRTLP